jgi:hypothetical protein
MHGWLIVLVVDIEPDVEHGCLLKSLYLGNAATEFLVTRLTGASFIVSTPKSIEPRLIRATTRMSLRFC